MKSFSASTTKSKLWTMIEVMNKLLEISNNIQELIEVKDEMPNGDFQGAIEAQISMAYQLGKNSK